MQRSSSETVPVVGAFLGLGLAVGFPWNALLSSTDLYLARIERASLSQVEAAITLAYFAANLGTFALLPGLRRWCCCRAAEARAEEPWSMWSFLGVNLLTFASLSASPWMPGVRDEAMLVALVVVAALLGSTSAVFQRVLFAVAARDVVPGATNSFVVGFAAAGTLSSGTSLFTRSLAAAENATYVFASNFFMTVVSLVLGCGAAWYLRLREKAAEKSAYKALDARDGGNSHEEEKLADVDVDDDDKNDNLPKFRKMLGVVGLTMCGTLLVFPGVVSALQPSDSVENYGNINNHDLRVVINSVAEDANQFTSMLFFLFNVGDFTGRALGPLFVSSCFSRHPPREDNIWVALCIVRTLLLGLFFACNRGPPGTAGGGGLLLLPAHVTQTDSFAYFIDLAHGVWGGILFSVGSREATLALANKSRTGNALAVTISVSLALGAVLGAVISFSLGL